MEFAEDFDFTFTNDNVDMLAFRPSQLSVFKKTTFARFSLGAVQSAKPGIVALYPIVAIKSTASNTNASTLPMISLVIRDTKCPVSANNPSYKIPDDRAGTTLPIILDFYNCFPVQDVSVTPAFSSPDVELDPLYTVSQINATDANDSRVIFVVRKKTSAPLLTANAIITMSFVFAGTNGPSYQMQSTVQLLVVNTISENLDYKPKPYQVANLTTNQNTVAMNLQCDQPAIIFWAIGITPSLDAVPLFLFISKKLLTP